MYWISKPGMLRFSLRNSYKAQPDIFDAMPFPAGADRELFIKVLMQRCGSLAVQPEQEDLKDAVTTWGAQRLYSLETAWNSTQQHYNIVENYDRYEELQTDGESRSAGYETESPMKPVSSGTTKQLNHIHGNIGVTTSAQMLQGERDISSYSFYVAAADLFADDLCVSIFM